MPLGSSKISVNKNKPIGGGTTPSDPASFVINDVLSNDYLDAQGYTNLPRIIEPYQTVTYNITSNRPNATLDFTISGTGIVADDFDAPITGNITTDGNGDATLIRTVESDLSLNTNVNFTLNLIRESTSQVMATSNTYNIYNIEFPNVSLTGNVTSFDTTIDNLIFDGTVHQIYANATVTINNLGTLQDNVFQLLIAANVEPTGIVENMVYRERPLPVAVIGGGGGGSSNDAGGGGAGGEVIYLQDSYVSQLTETTYNFTIGDGGQAGVDGENSVAFAGETFEISALGGGSPTGGNGGSIDGISGGSQAGNPPFNNTYGGGGGANRMQFYKWNENDTIDSGIPGTDGRVQRIGFTSNYNAYGGAGAGISYSSGGTVIDQITTRVQWPDFNNTNPTQQVFFGMGGGGGAFTTTAGGETRGNSGDPGDNFGRGGTSVIPAMDGRESAGMGGGGSGLGSYETQGGSGLIIMRVPKGPDFRFITSQSY